MQRVELATFTGLPCLRGSIMSRNLDYRDMRAVSCSGRHPVLRPSATCQFLDSHHQGEKKLMKKAMLSAAAIMALASSAFAQVRISEWAYQGVEGEFIEFTNYGPGAVDFTGWSFDDDSREPGTVSLSAFGVVAPGEAVILAEFSEADFRSAWGLNAAVKIIGENATNLGRNDEINIYDAGNNLVDRLAFGDQNFPGTIRTQNISGNPLALSDMETDNVGDSNWVFSAVGDSYGSFTSANGDIGNPGIAPLYNGVVPEPGTFVLAGLAMLGFAVRRR